MTDESTPVLYFAYGSNVPTSQLRSRCRNAVARGPAWLSGWRLAFSYYATIRPAPAARVPGIVWQLSEGELRALDRYEGHPRKYRREQVVVERFDGGVERAWVYIMNQDPDLPPEDWYVDILREGYEEWGLPLRPLSEAIALARQTVQPRRE